MTIGADAPAVDVATGYTSKRKAFGRPVAGFQGVSFQVAEAVTLLDAARAMSYTTARGVDEQIHEKRIRRMVSQSKKFVIWNWMPLKLRQSTKKYFNSFEGLRKSPKDLLMDMTQELILSINPSKRVIHDITSHPAIKAKISCAARIRVYVAVDVKR